MLIGKENFLFIPLTEILDPTCQTSYFELYGIQEEEINVSINVH